MRHAYTQIGTPSFYRILVLITLALVLTVSACSGFGNQAGNPSQDESPVEIKPPGTPDEYLLAVGELEPNFGGFFFNGGRLNVYLLNADTATRAEKDHVLRSLVRVYGSDFPATSSATTTFLKGDYGMVDLYTWYARFDEVRSVDGVSFTDLDEARNRLAVGVIAESIKPEVEQVLTRLEIPLAAVILEVEGYACPDIGWYPIAAQVRDADGQPAARGAQVTITKSGYEETGTGFGDPLEIYVGESVGGTFDVEVTKPYYDSVTVEDVEVATNECGIGETVKVPVTLTLQADAPPVRQVVVAPYGIGLGGGSSLQEAAYVEAAPGVSKKVVWRSDDEGVATVSADGTITGVCRDTYGETLVTATSVADPSKSGAISVSVHPADPEYGTCP